MILTIPYKPLSRCGIDELAAQQAMNERRGRRLGGVMFARKDETPEKDAARRAILDLLTLDAMPGRLDLLTMPGLHWGFETQLLKQRDPHWRLQQEIEHTRLTCVENDRYVYYSAATKMPGNKHCTVRSLDRPEYAERAIGHGVVDRYIFANVDDLMAGRSEQFDAAWLDYTGPMTVERMRLVAHFWSACVRRLLVVTSLRARWNKEAGRNIDKHGGVLQWKQHCLHGRIAHAIEYQDGASPMAQFAVFRSES